MSNSQTLITADPDARLDTGMKVKEAIERAKLWWNGFGRYGMIAEKERQEKIKGTAFCSDNPDDSNFLPSGILNGHEWDLLTKREKLRLVKFWHHFFIRNQDIIGSDAHKYKFGQRDTIK